MLDPNDLYQPKEEVISKKLDDEIVLVDLETESIYSLNETGARFWELMGEKKSIDQIIIELQDEYEITEEELQIELETIICQLLEQGLIQYVE